MHPSRKSHPYDPPSHPLLSMQFSPSSSSVSLISTILPDISHIDAAPPDGEYTPLFSPEKSSGNEHRTLPTTWEGPSCGTVGGSPSEIGTGEYEALVRRVEEVLGMNTAMEEECERFENDEVSLLMKVQEVLAADERDTRAHRETEDAHHSGSRHHYLRTDAMEEDVDVDHPYERHINAVRRRQPQEDPTGIDFSLADGTYIHPRRIHRDGSNVRRQQKENEPDTSFSSRRGRPNSSLANAGRSLSPIQAMQEGESQCTGMSSMSDDDASTSMTDFQVRLLHSYQNEHRSLSEYGGSRPRTENPTGGAGATRSAGIPIQVPRIEYESFVDDDTMMEGQVGAVMARYISPHSDHRSPWTSNGPTHAGMNSHPPKSEDVQPPRPASRHSVLSDTTNLSTTFSDQLSLASLQYLKRHNLMDGSPRQPTSKASSHHRSPTTRRDLGATRSGETIIPSLYTEQMTKILDVERIRMLPKLGMPR
ncbi:hypothetical protein BC832DRAFT_560634 [Gaertneriomyces semiglobifer]|nr:hypothetical protein BC832DRAFT_560634 [Gaertneriomyces semiglobifer]